MQKKYKEYCDTRERILAVERILQSSTKPMTSQAIVDKLERAYDIRTSRHTVISDINAMTRFMDIQHAGRFKGFYIAGNKAEENI